MHTATCQPTTVVLTDSRAHPDLDAAQLARSDQPLQWSCGPAREEVAKLDRLLDRLPPRFATVLDLRSRGMSTARIGAILGITQPGAWQRLRTATRAAAWAAARLPDLLPFEVEERVLASGELPREAAMAASYWATWQTTATVDEDGQPIAQGTAWGALRRLAARLVESDPEVGEGLRLLLGSESLPYREGWRVQPPGAVQVG